MAIKMTGYSRLSVPGVKSDFTNLFTFHLYGSKRISLIALSVFIFVFWVGLWSYSVIDDVLKNDESVKMQYWTID